jgi:predicted dehydrogenase
MESIISAGVIGANRHAKMLVAHLAPIRGVRLLRWAASPEDQDRPEAAALASRAHISFSLNWQTVAEDPSLGGLVVLSDGPKKIDAVVAGLSAGKIVLCPAPAATSPVDVNKIAEAQERGGGTLLSPSEIAHTEAGGRGIKIIADDAFGTLHSLYLSIRTPRGDRAPSDGVLAELGWEALNFLLVCLRRKARRVYATGGHLFGPGSDPDTVVGILRFEDSIIATIDLSRCLPRTIPITGLGEVEMEAIGARQVVRIEPHKTAIGVHQDGAVAARQWVDDPIVSMVGYLGSVADGTLPKVSDLDRLRGSVGLMDAVRGSIGSSRAVEY